MTEQQPAAGSSAFERTEADTVMFASTRAVMPNPTSENWFVGVDRAGSAAPSGPGRTTGPGPRAARHQKGVHQRAARQRPGRQVADAESWPPSSPRRVWLSRGVLVLIMVLQALLTLRMSNTAFEDEGLYLYVGHLEIRHFLHGAALQGDYPSYFSGAPVLYPVLGALADSIGGLAAARALSLLEMLAVTGLIYAMSRRLFNERVALCAAVVYAVTEPARSSATWPPTTPPRCSCSPWPPGWWFGSRAARASSTCWPRRSSRSPSPPSTRPCCSCRASSAWPGWPCPDSAARR